MAHWGCAAGRYTASLGPVFFIDDSRLTTSSQEAAITATQATSDYAISTGVVFETKVNSKSTMVITPQEEVHPKLQSALQGTLLGGAPAITQDTKFLGAQEKAGVPMSITALKQIERVGSMAGLEMTRAATRLRWPAHLRKVCMERTATQVLNVLPLAVPAPMAAARLNSLQGRWAHQVLRGTKYHMDKRLTRAQIQKIRRDLGWTPLWNIAKEYAVMLYQRMRNEPPGQPHTEWARQDPPPKGTWIAYVRSMQNSHKIGDLELPMHVQQSPNISQRKNKSGNMRNKLYDPR